MGDGIRIFQLAELEVFGADYAGAPSEFEGLTTANLLSDTSSETVWTTRLGELYERDAWIAYAFRARLVQDGTSDTTNLRRGDRGPRVLALQETLVRLGHLSPAALATGPGIFGARTEAALKEFQRANGLIANGIYDGATQAVVEAITGGDLRLSAQIRERTSRTRQAVTSPVLGDFTVTASFMDPDGHGYKRNGAYAIFSGDPQTVVRIRPSRVNLGIDYVTPDGRIRNWFAGTVERTTYEPDGYGYRAVIRTDLTYRLDGRDYAVYAHYAHAAEAFNLEAGDRVEPGQDIGRMGNTGASLGAHVDFRTWIQLGDGRRVDVSPNLLVAQLRNTTTTTPVQTQTENRPAGELNLGVNERYRDALLLAQQRTGIDAAALAGLVNAEAARDRDGRWIADSYNASSGARGLTQFLAGTWVDRATAAGTYLNEVAVARGFVRRDENGRFVVVNRQALLDLRNDPTASIVSAAEYGRDNLRSLEGYGVLPANMTDDDRARYMYYAHHEGLAGAVRLLTDSRGVTEEAARRALVTGRGRQRALAMMREHGSYAAAFRVWTEERARYLFPTQVGNGREGRRVIDRYVAEHGDYEHGYRAWLEEYTARQVRPENYRR